MKLTSSAFTAGARIPARYTCDDADISPPLAWNAPPAGTRSFALLMDDPDAPGGRPWVHWVIFNLPADTEALPEFIATNPELPDGSRQGHNSWGRVGYGGPCPPQGSHRYVFKLYALDAFLDLPPGATKAQVLAALKPHILAQAELIGTYARS